MRVRLRLERAALPNRSEGGCCSVWVERVQVGMSTCCCSMAQDVVQKGHHRLPRLHIFCIKNRLPSKNCITLGVMLNFDATQLLPQNANKLNSI